jgi:hypothetical protein
LGFVKRNSEDHVEFRVRELATRVSELKFRDFRDRTVGGAIDNSTAEVVIAELGLSSTSLRFARLDLIMSKMHFE